MMLSTPILPTACPAPTLHHGFDTTLSSLFSYYNLPAEFAIANQTAAGQHPDVPVAPVPMSDSALLGFADPWGRPFEMGGAGAGANGMPFGQQGDEQHDFSDLLLPAESAMQEQTSPVAIPQLDGAAMMMMAVGLVATNSPVTTRATASPVVADAAKSLGSEEVSDVEVERDILIEGLEMSDVDDMLREMEERSEANKALEEVGDLVADGPQEMLSELGRENGTDASGEVDMILESTDATPAADVAPAAMTRPVQAHTTAVVSPVLAASGASDSSAPLSPASVMTDITLPELDTLPPPAVPTVALSPTTPAVPCPLPPPVVINTVQLPQLDPTPLPLLITMQLPKPVVGPPIAVAYAMPGIPMKPRREPSAEPGVTRPRAAVKAAGPSGLPPMLESLLKSGGVRGSLETATVVPRKGVEVKKRTATKRPAEESDAQPVKA
ncbi:hypothetical protein HK101_003053 [Irineochytrium annulatum]|nr:hypothetical protein HK101_003053 [Irineochytrium annulatum]